jgi:hypothetical protein
MIVRPPQISQEWWSELLPHLERQPAGGITLLAIENIASQNWPRITTATFGPEARTRLRHALQGEKKRRENAKQ